jgi:hypothetical protein
MTLVGAAVTPRLGQTFPQAITAFETLTGRRLPARRCYDPGVPATFTQTAMRFDAGQRRSIWSFKPAVSTADTALKTLAASIHDSGHPCDVIIRHEPVDDKDLIDPAAFIKLYNRAAAIFKAAGLPVGVCYTNYSCNLPYSHPHSALRHYWPGSDLVDFVAIDDYPIGEITDTSDAPPMDVRTLRVAQFTDAHGIQLAVAEYGVDPTWDTAKSERWMRSVCDWAAQRAGHGKPLRFLNYFHSDVGAQGDYWLTHPEHIDAYKDAYRTLSQR